MNRGRTCARRPSACARLRAAARGTGLTGHPWRRAATYRAAHAGVVAASAGTAARDAAAHFAARACSSAAGLCFVTARGDG